MIFWHILAYAFEHCQLGLYDPTRLSHEGRHAAVLSLAASPGYTGSSQGANIWLQNDLTCSGIPISWAQKIYRFLSFFVVPRFDVTVSLILFRNFLRSDSIFCLAGDWREWKGVVPWQWDSCRWDCCRLSVTSPVPIETVQELEMDGIVMDEHEEARGKTAAPLLPSWLLAQDSKGKRKLVAQFPGLFQEV